MDREAVLVIACFLAVVAGIVVYRVTSAAKKGKEQTSSSQDEPAASSPEDKPIRKDWWDTQPSTPQGPIELPSQKEADPQEPVELVCWQCRASVPQGAKYCSRCGSKVLIKTCLYCGVSLKGNEAFCPSCGQKTPFERAVTKAERSPEAKIALGILMAATVAFCLYLVIHGIMSFRW